MRGAPANPSINGFGAEFDSRYSLIQSSSPDNENGIGNGGSSSATALASSSQKEFQDWKHGNANVGGNVQGGNMGVSVDNPYINNGNWTQAESQGNEAPGDGQSFSGNIGHGQNSFR